MVSNEINVDLYSVYTVYCICTMEPVECLG